MICEVYQCHACNVPYIEYNVTVTNNEQRMERGEGRRRGGVRRGEGRGEREERERRGRGGREGEREGVNSNTHTEH